MYQHTITFTICSDEGVSAEGFREFADAAHGHLNEINCTMGILPDGSDTQSKLNCSFENFVEVTINEEK